MFKKNTLLLAYLLVAIIFNTGMYLNSEFPEGLVITSIVILIYLIVFTFFEEPENDESLICSELDKNEK